MNSPGAEEIADIKHKAEAAKAELQQLSATLTSKDGAATVTVNASGALQRLTFNPRAQGIPLNELAASVLATAQRAQAQAARQITAIMAPVIGTESDAMKFLEEQFPAPEVPDEELPPPGQPPLVLNEEQAAPPPVRPPAPPRPARPAAPPPPRPARPPVEDDGDDDFGSVLRRDW